MKLATSTNIMDADCDRPYRIPVDVSARACARAGYQYVDACLCSYCREGQPLRGEYWEKWIEETVALKEELNIQFPQAHAYWTIGEGFLPDRTRSDGELGEELMRRSVLAAEALGVKWMVVHPYSMSRHGGYDYRGSYKYNVEYWKRWGEFYAEHNVGMAIENMNRPTHYGSCAEEMLELIDAVGNPMVQICIDTGHANMVGLDVPAMIRQVGFHLKATHINDNHGTTDEHFAPYNGTIPWKETVQALRDIHYQECFAFEIHHLTSMYPKEVQSALVDFSYVLGTYLLGEQQE